MRWNCNRSFSHRSQKPLTAVLGQVPMGENPHQIRIKPSYLPTKTTIPRTTPHYDNSPPDQCQRENHSSGLIYTRYGIVLVGSCPDTAHSMRTSTIAIHSISMAGNLTAVLVFVRAKLLAQKMKIFYDFWEMTFCDSTLFYSFWFKRVFLYLNVLGKEYYS